MVSPSDKRESALSKMLGRLGDTQTQEQRYNNGFAHYSLAVHSSFIRSFELGMHQIISNVEATIRDAVPADDTISQETVNQLIGKTVSLNRPLFLDRMPLTKWIENFYQESPSINARAREDQVKIGMEAFKTPPMFTYTPFGESDDAPDSSKGKKK